MKQGESFEQYVLNLCHADGFTLMRKTDPAVRIIQWYGNNQFKGCFLEEGMLDLTGPMHGFHAEIEVKDCKGMRFPLSKLRPHQYRRIEDLYDDISLAGLVLRLRGATANDDHILLFPAREVIKLKADGKKSIMWKEAKPLVDEGLVLEHTYRSKGDIRKFMKMMVDTTPER